jgi:glycine/D-amino acid oxidase-like deaminating enzyme
MLDLSAKPEIEFIWDGLAAVTPDFAPKLFSLGHHMVATTSCNGRGIAMSVALGRHLGAAIADGDLSRLPLPLSTPGREGRRLALRAGLSAFPLLGLAGDGRPFIPPARPPAQQEASLS